MSEYRQRPEKCQRAAAVIHLGRQLDEAAIAKRRDEVRTEGRALAAKLLGDADCYDLMVDIARRGGHGKAVAK